MLSHIVLLGSLFFGILAGPTPNNKANENNFLRDDTNYKLILQSIEEKLNNIDSSLIIQYATVLNGKMDFYGRKIDNIEKELGKLQHFLQLEMYKISESISSKNYRDDVTKDRTLIKIDGIYEKIHHKLENIQDQMDVTELKIQNGRQEVLSKLENIKENLNIRDSDIEAEVADAVAAIDDLKMSWAIEENFTNRTREDTSVHLKTYEKMMITFHNNTINVMEKVNETIRKEIVDLQISVKTLANQTENNTRLINSSTKQADENVNNYANKFVNLYLDITEKQGNLQEQLRELTQMSNVTQMRQENAFRNLLIEVGRIRGKNNKNVVISDETLNTLVQHIDTKLDNIALAQNLFSENCYKMQMDESHLETQISIILQKIIDIFENKTTVTLNDIKFLENIIHSHDSNIRSKLHQVTENWSFLLREIERNVESVLKNHTNTQNLQFEIMLTKFQEVIKSGTNKVDFLKFADILKDFQQLINVTHKEVLKLSKHINLTENYQNVQKLLETSQLMHNIVGDIKNTLKSVEKNINHLLIENTKMYEFNTESSLYIDNLETLTETILENESKVINSYTDVNKYPDVFKIFGIKTNHSVDHHIKNITEINNVETPCLEGSIFCNNIKLEEAVDFTDLYKKRTFEVNTTNNEVKLDLSGKNMSNCLTVYQNTGKNGTINVVSVAP